MMKRRSFDVWGSASLAAFTLVVTLIALYGFLAYGPQLWGSLQLP